MTENKRFVSYFDKDNNYLIQDLTEEDEYQVGFVHCDEDLILNLMNELNDENEFLKVYNTSLNDGAEKYSKLYHNALKENEYLKKQLRIFEDGLKAEIRETKIAMEDWNESLEENRKLKLDKESEIAVLEKENFQLKEDLCYYKAKCASLEEGLVNQDSDISKLEKENKELKSDRDYWKTLAQSLSKKNGKGDFEWLKISS